MKLSSEQIEFYDRNGYLIFDTSIPESVFDEIINDLKPIYDGEKRPELGFQGPGRVQDGWKISPRIKSLALDPDILGALEQIYGRKPLAFQTLNFSAGTEQRPHSDTIHFNSQPPGFMCGVWIALEDMDLDNGTLIFFPTSHKLPEVTLRDVGCEMETPSPYNLSQLFRRGLRKFGIINSLPTLKTDDAYPLYEKYIGNVIEENNLEPKYAVIKKGQALIWASNLLHGGSPQKDRIRTRHSQVTHYFFENCRYYTPMLSNSSYTYWREPEWIV